MRRLFTALRTLVYAIGFVWLWGWIALGVRTYDQRLPNLLPAWSPILGIILMSIGGLCVLACLSTFVIRGKGTPAPFDPPREFVAVGPYRYVRNPMYIGGWIVLAGFGLYEESISILLFSFVWILIFHFFVLLVEEPGLTKRFGDSYLEHKKSVNRWTPRWK